MFVHETHSFYILAKLDSCKNAPARYLEKKYALFNNVLSNVGIDKVAGFEDLWQLKEQMYSSSSDVFDILSNEMIRLVSQDTSIPTSEKKLYELSPANDHIIISEYLTENTYYIK